jgi:hypothetical protein
MVIGNGTMYCVVAQFSVAIVDCSYMFRVLECVHEEASKSNL